MIYFIQAEGAPERVKIGKAHDVKRRMYELSRYPSSAWRTPDDIAPLTLLVECEGHSECEAQLHRMLKPYRLWGEWFDCTVPVVAQVVAYAMQHGRGALAGLCGEALATDRARATPGCEHTAMRAMHPTGACLLCDDVGAPLTSPEKHQLKVDVFPLAPIPRAVVLSAPNVGPSGSDSTTDHDPDASAILTALGHEVSEAIDHDAADAMALESELLAYSAAIDAELARRSFAEFVRQAVTAGVVPGLARVEWAPHLDALCDETQAMLEGWLVAHGFGTDEMIARVDAQWVAHGLTRESGELLVQNWIGNVPPGTLKSTIIMVLGNAWVWLHCPRFKFGAASGIDKNVERDSDATRDVVTSVWYREHFGIDWTIRGDTNSKSLWVTTAGGMRLSVTLSTGFTGQHVDGAFIDDPDDADKVWGEPARRFVQNRWTRALENRVVDERNSIRMVLQQRVHVDDFTAYLLGFGMWASDNRKGWAWCCIPLEYGKAPKGAPDATPFGWRDWRKTAGEIMHPARFPQSVIDDKRIKLGTHGYDSQYNQHPTPLDGGLIRRSSLKWFVIEGTPEAVNWTVLRKRPDGCLQRDVLPPTILGRDKRTGLLDLEWVTVTVDCSNGSTNATASAVGLLVCGGKDEERYVLDDRTMVMGPLEMDAAIKAAVCAWSPQCGRVLVELKAAGETMIALLGKAMSKGDLKGTDGKPVQVVVEKVQVPASDGKIVRARAMVPAVDQGHLFVLDGAPWVYEQKTDTTTKISNLGFVAEVCAFPFAKRNDRIDALAQLMTYYREDGEAESRARALNVY